MWKRRIAKAWALYRHGAALRGLLDAFGVWKPIALGAPIVIATIVAVWAEIPFWQSAILWAAMLAMSLFFVGFLAAYRIIKRIDTRDDKVILLSKLQLENMIRGTAEESEIVALKKTLAKYEPTTVRSRINAGRDEAIQLRADIGRLIKDADTYGGKQVPIFKAWFSEVEEFLLENSPSYAKAWRDLLTNGNQSIGETDEQIKWRLCTSFLRNLQNNVTRYSLGERNTSIIGNHDYDY